MYDQHSHHALESLFRPRAIALVGATERSLWTNMTYGNLTRHGFPGKIHMVNRNGGVVFERPAAISCAAIGEAVDLALLMVPENALDGAIDDLGVAGIRNAVILTAGFAETGKQGAQRQAELAARLKDKDIRLLGPNCLGFINFVDRVPLFTTQRRAQRETGAVAVVSQSGAVGSIIADVAYHQNVPLTYLVSTGNEVDIDVAAVIDYLAEEPNTKVICAFLETVRDGARFAKAAWKAHMAGKPLVVLKVGASEISAKAAQAHTGSLVGDDRVFDAACRRLGMVRVGSPEELVLTADLLARLGPVQGSFALAAMSGGMCEIAADRASAEGLTMPPLSAATVEGLRAVMPGYGTPNNPLDFTGAAMLNPELIEQMLRVLVRDPVLGVVACVFDAPDSEDRTGFVSKVFQSIGRGFAAAGKPTLVLSNISAPVTKAGRELTHSAGVPYFGVGVDRGIRGLARACAWWTRRQRLGQLQAPAAGAASAAALTEPRPASEREVLNHLAAHGVPVIPAQITRSAEEAACIARSLGGPTVLKIVSPQIQHKSDVGGVALNVTPDAAADTWRRMMNQVCSAQPDAVIEGIIVSPMRRGGVELFVGTMRDPVWGPVIAVGLGGVFVEALKDTALRLLPVDVDDVMEMLDELRGRALLNGFRGAPAVQRLTLAEAIVKIGQAALALGPALIALEVNPLLATESGAEALDGLAVWNEEHDHAA